MADRVSASITIGGTLPATALAGLAATIQLERLSTEWDGEPFTLDDMPENAPLSLMAHEVAWGRFEQLEAFCIRSEEHTSELQSLMRISYAVFCLKKNTKAL